MTPTDRQAERIAGDRLEALRTRLQAAPQGSGDGAKAQRRMALRMAETYVAKWPQASAAESRAIRQAADVLEAYRLGCLPTPPPAPEVLTVGALRALLQGLPAELPLTRVLADPGTLVAVAQSLALVPPVQRFPAKGTAKPRARGFSNDPLTPEAMGLF